MAATRDDLHVLGHGRRFLDDFHDWSRTVDLRRSDSAELLGVLHSPTTPGVGFVEIRTKLLAEFESDCCGRPSVHANAMNVDLYKHAYRLSPLVPSELVADCFELASAIRTVDMRASPYDLTDPWYEPIRIETAEGKAQYVEAQRDFAARAEPLRARLIETCDEIAATERQGLNRSDDKGARTNLSRLNPVAQLPIRDA